MLEYFARHYIDLLRALVEHVEMCVIALFLASLIALPVGYALSRTNSGVTNSVLGVSGTLYSIPSMALLALLIPVFGLGNVSAVIALIFYAQFVLVRSVLLGFRSVDPQVLEAGKGMGLASLQMLFRLELPLAMPTILGGLRIAAASVISIASLAAWINAGGLGSILFEGIYQNRIGEVLWATLLISGLALTIEWVLSDIEKHVLREAQGKVGSEP